MTARRDRDPRPYLHGLHGAVVVVPARVAAWLNRQGLDSLRAVALGVDSEVDDVLAALQLAGEHWRASAQTEAAAEVPGASAEATSVSEWMNTQQVADRLGVTDRAVRLAIGEQRLPAELVNGRWQIARDAVEHYRARRAA